LRSPDFFDVAKYPFLTFVSKKISRIDTTKIQVTGDLTSEALPKRSQWIWKARRRRLRIREER